MDTRISRMMVTALTLLALVASAQAGWLGVGGAEGTPPRIATAERAPGQTEISIDLAGLEADPVVIGGVEYTKLVLPGHVQLLERGAPQVPYITTSLIIPGQGMPDVRVTKTTYREFAIAPVVPSKGPIPRTVDPETVAYEFGPAYQGGVFPVEIAELSDPYLVRDFRGVNVRLYPVQWDVDRGVLRVLESVTLEVTTAGSGGINAQTRATGALTRSFAALYAQKFDNYDAGAKYSINADEGPLLIVCYDAFAGAMQPFVDWKRQRGLAVELITTSSVGGTVAGIQSAIQTRYDSPEGLAFVVLVGDGAQVPHYSGAVEGADDDTRYMRLAGIDPYPDALISRISATNPSEVSTQVVKFVTYERDIAGAADWTHRATGIASNEGSPSDAVRADWLRDDLLAYTYTDVDRIYQGQGGTTAGITNAINDGRSLVNYLGHGSGTSWGSVYFSNSNVNALTNTAWPWIIDVACLNGGISAIGTSFAEAWMRAGSPVQPYGAIGMYAASTSCPWVPPCVMQAEAVDLLCAETSNTIGVLVHAGIMAVLDEYGTSGTGLQLIEQYNLFGDCSLMVRTASPASLTVVHHPEVPLYAPTYAVDAGAAGVTVTLSGNGTIYGTGTTDAGGQVTLTMAHDLDTIGEATLTVFGYNQETYVSTVQVVVPANVEIVPLAVPVGVTTPVTITVTDPDTGDGLGDVMVDVAGFGFASDAVQTDAAGRVTIDVMPEYGETLAIRGREIGADFDMFIEDLVVTGAGMLGSPAVTAAVPAIGMEGTLTPHIAGEVTASIRDLGFRLFLDSDTRSEFHDATGTELTVAYTPIDLADLTATIARPGFHIFQQQIAVVPSFGTLAGTVVDADNGNAPVAGARIYGFAEGAQGGVPLFDLTTGPDGTFAMSEELTVGYYDLFVEKFGYLPHQEVYFQEFGAADHPVALVLAPAGTLSGAVTAADLGTPLDATLRFFRTDNGELFATATTDPGSGLYLSGPLPFFSYDLQVTSPGHIPFAGTVTISEASAVADFALESTVADVLLLDDNSTFARQVPAKFDTEGTFVAPAYPARADRAAADIAAALQNAGYSVVAEDAATSDAETWTQYGMVLVSAGANTGPFADATLRGDVTAFVEGGGRLMVEGGEIAYALNYSDATFLQTVLHVTSWNGDASGDLSVQDAAHPVVTVPNEVPVIISNTYVGYGDADRVTVADTGHLVCDWTTYDGKASVVVHDMDADPQFGQFVFFTFNYSAMGSGIDGLLANAVHYLIGEPAAADTTPVEDLRIPTVLTLRGNHPNPFNPKTVIEFALPTDQDVTLAVFDLRGQRVRTLVRGLRAAGTHQAVWLGRDDTGRQVASGTYFYRLTAGGENLVGKMLLLK